VLAMNNTQLQAALHCRQKWQFLHDGLYVAATFPMARGTILHRGRQENLSQKKDSKIDLPFDEVLDYTIGQIRELEFVPDKDGLIMERVVRSGAEKDYHVFQTRTQPVLVEEKIEVNPKGYSFSLYGTLDLFTTDGWVDDLKTVSRRKNPFFTHRSRQLSIYWMLARKLGLQPTGARHLFLEFSKYSVTANAVQTTRTPEDLQSTLNEIQCVVEGIERGDITGAADDSIYCPCQFAAYCPFITKHAKQFSIGGSDE
jgi:hypothetical protein